jgi:uncharacterized protein (TIGR03643 family)
MIFPQPTTEKLSPDLSTNRSEALSVEDTSRIIEMAWEDRTTFEAIRLQYGLMEKEVIALMRREMKRSSFAMWRERVTGRSTKHEKVRNARAASDGESERKYRFVSDNQKSTPRRRK